MGAVRPRADRVVRGMSFYDSLSFPRVVGLIRGCPGVRVVPGSAWPSAELWRTLGCIGFTMFVSVRKFSEQY